MAAVTGLAWPANAAVEHPAGHAGHLGKAAVIPGLQALNVGGMAAVSAVRCAAPGSCTAAGFYVDGHGLHQAFVASETGFKWAKAVPVPGLAGLGGGRPTDITALTCPAAGQCAIGGWYVDTSGNLQAFVASSANGVFGQATGIFHVTDQVPSFVARVTALDCATPGNCTAALEIPEFQLGGGDPIPRAFVVTQTSGQWGTPAPVDVPGVSATTPTGISSVSCWAPAGCLAVGGSGDVGTERPILATQGSGTWGFQNTVPGLDGQGVIDFNPNADAAATQVSCFAATACSVAGIYGDHHGNQQVFTADWASGHWFTQTIPDSAELNQGGNAFVNGLSCGANGGCAAAGQVTVDTQSDIQSLASSRLRGTWSNAQEISGIDNLPSSDALAVSCPPSGGCLIGGFYVDGKNKQQAYISAESTLEGTTDFGTFGGAQLIAGNLNAGGTAAVNDIFCSRASECAIGGFYTDSHGKQQGFVAVKSAGTVTTLTLSAARVKAGHEHAERLTVRVKAVAGGTPAGKVTVKTGRVTLCVIAIKGGSGSCRLSQNKLRPGTYKLAARYGGGTIYTPSDSQKKTLTVTR
ncbi:MAG TPA: Ig-like domain-containing protein [Streptosporangiaceae bacterium]|nr:Ig-like domain-containing protein [Streptosporangiaceae bacterium]